MWRRFAGESGHRDWLVARTEIVEQAGVGGAHPLPDDDGTLVFDAFFRDLLSRFHVDPDRIYVTGLSQTGFWAWQLGVARADRFAGIAPMSAVSTRFDPFAGNLLALRVHVLHGDADPTCPVDQPRGTHAILRRIGVDAEYVEIAGGGHDYAVWKNLPDGLRRLGETPRVRYPRRISKSVRNTSAPWCAWLRIDAIETEGKRDATDPPTAGVDAEVDGQSIRLFSDGVTALTVGLSSDLVDLGKPVTITWNGKVVHDGVVAPSVAGLFERVGEKCDWTATLEAAVSLKR
jgi:hypothetical protein